jgi:cytochrome c oxidase subunit 2
MKKILMLLLFGVLAAYSVSLRAQAAPQRIVIEAKRFSYNPPEITLKKGQPVILVVKSDDVAHGLRFRELNVNIKVKAHGTAEAQFTPMETGDFVGHCSVFCGTGHGSMAIKLHVVD